MKTCEGSEVIAPQLLTSALNGRERAASRLGRYTLGKEPPGTHWIGA
jgi:hypothetical protein